MDRERMKEEPEVHCLEKEAVYRLSQYLDEPEWMVEKRQRAFHIAESLPLPSTRYTDWGGLKMEKIHLLFPDPVKATEGVPGWMGETFKETTVFVQRDSTVVYLHLPENLRKKGVILTDFPTAIQKYPDLLKHYWMTESIPPESGKMAALLGAFASGGAFLYVPENVEISFPLHARFLNTTRGIGLFTPLLLILERGSHVTFLQEFHSVFGESTLAKKDGFPSGLHTQAVEVFLKEDASLDFASLENPHIQMASFYFKKAILERDAKITWTLGWVGSAVTQSRLDNYLMGEGARAEDLQIFFGTGRQHYDLSSNLAHKARYTRGDVLVKGVLKDRARSVFQGLIRIFPEGQNADAYQAAHTMLLNAGARSDAIPSLEIQANDVRCTHSASTGQIDEDQIFYLMSRGLTENEAQKLIVEGFFEPAIRRIPIPGVQESIKRLMEQKWLGIL